MAVEKVTDEIKEVEIAEEPEGLPVDVEIEGEEQVTAEEVRDDFNSNLALEMDERTLKSMGSDLIDEYKKIKLQEKNGKTLT